MAGQAVVLGACEAAHRSLSESATLAEPFDKSLAVETTFEAAEAAVWMAAAGRSFGAAQSLRRIARADHDSEEFLANLTLGIGYLDLGKPDQADAPLHRADEMAKHIPLLRRDPRFTGWAAAAAYHLGH